MSDIDSYKAGFASLIGPANAGKSTLLNSLLGKKIAIESSKAQSTRAKVLGILTRENYQVIFVDTPGFFPRRKGDLLGRFLEENLHQATREVDIGILVLDALRCFKNKRYVEKALSAAEELGSFQVIALNKIDKISYNDLITLLSSFEEVINDRYEIIPLSAKKKENLEEFLKLASNFLPQSPPFYPTGSATPESEEFIASELVREQVYKFTEQELPWNTAVKIEKWEEREGLISIFAVVFVSKNSHKPIVIGKNGSKLKQIGTAARLDLEKLLGVKVFLNIFVRVEKNWTTSRKGFEKVGY